MKKHVFFLLLILAFPISKAFAQTPVTTTVRPGGIVTLASTNEHIITMVSDYTVTGCNWIRVEVISAASGVKITSVATATASPIDWTNYQANVAGTSTTVQYCAASTFPYQRAVVIRAIGPAGAVLKFHF